MGYFVQYGSVRIDFDLHFAERKTLNIAVHPDRRVEVTAPMNSPLEKIEAKVRKRAAWIVRQQRFFLGFEPRTPPRRYVSGESHLYLGRNYRLKIVEDKRPEVKLNGGHFWARTPVQGEWARRKAVQELMDGWYREKAHRRFPEIAAPYLRRFARLGAVPTDFVISRMEKRWGSCTAKGIVILNTDLIRAPRGCIEYVIVHELCHLLQHDHGAKFQQLQAQEFPEWKKWKDILETRMV
jgi:predicted metal-dependent hydrolase